MEKISPLIKSLKKEDSNPWSQTPPFLCSKVDTCSWTPVAHTCNPSYSGGRDRENESSKPAQASILKIPITTRTGGVAQGEVKKKNRYLVNFQNLWSKFMYMQIPNTF
jgi:hypothetical protein